MSPTRSSRTALLACLGAVAITAAACTSGGSDSSVQATDAARSFLESWSSGQFAQSAGLTNDSKAAAAAMQAAKTDLDATKVTFEAGKAKVSGDQANVDFGAHWTLAGISKPWSYSGMIGLRKT